LVLWWVGVVGGGGGGRVKRRHKGEAADFLQGLNLDTKKFCRNLGGKDA